MGSERTRNGRNGDARQGGGLAPGPAEPSNNGTGDTDRAASGAPRSGTETGKPRHRHGRRPSGRFRHVYAAVDLGTNNCRLLVARPKKEGFHVVDAFSRTVRLGEGLRESGALSADAMDRAVEALKICAAKMRRQRVTRARAIATEACRTAMNGPAFVERVKAETGIDFHVISPAEEAMLAARGCAPLVDPDADSVLVFDIGGGSTELIRLDLKEREAGGMPPIRCWASVPCGVVTLTEAFGPANEEAVFRRMVDEVRTLIQRALEQNAFCADYASRNVHMLGTSGTVTTLAGVHLGLKRYERNVIDGVWLELEDIRCISSRLAGMSCGERAQLPCIGPDRADLVVAGCAILEAIHEIWPCQRLRVADRGLREGVLLELMERADAEDRRRRRRPRRSRQKGSAGNTPDAPRSV